ncbi:hypothetical protein PJL70_08795 [Mycobacterium kansasii]|jgi:hypothetical protein
MSATFGETFQLLFDGTIKHWWPVYLAASLMIFMPVVVARIEEIGLLRPAVRVEELRPLMSASEARALANSLLMATTPDVPRLAGAPVDFDEKGLWREIAEGALTALIYTASQHPRPLVWLEDMVSRLGAGDAGWAEAAEAVGAVDSALCQWVKGASVMCRRQRYSVGLVVREAVLLYEAETKR